MQNNLKDLFLQRVEHNISEAVSKESDSIQEALHSFFEPVNFEYYKQTNQLSVLKEIFFKQKNEIFKMFFEPKNSLFFRYIDIKVIENIFFWSMEFYKYIFATDDKYTLKVLYPELKQILKFFLHFSSPYVNLKNRAYLETRLKDEWDFMEKNSFFISSYINSLWYNFLVIMHFFSMQMMDLEVTESTNKLIKYIEKTFVSQFWDEEENYLRFTYNDLIPVFSSLAIWTLSLNFNNLLFKQKRKKIIISTEKNFYSDYGLRLDLRKKTKSSQLLPIFWQAYLKNYKFTSNSLTYIKKKIKSHVESVNLLDFEIDNFHYNKNFFNFLSEVKLDI